MIKTYFPLHPQPLPGHTEGNNYAQLPSKRNILIKIISGWAIIELQSSYLSHPPPSYFIFFRSWSSFQISCDLLFKYLSGLFPLLVCFNFLIIFLPSRPSIPHLRSSSIPSILTSKQPVVWHQHIFFCHHILLHCSVFFRSQISNTKSYL